MRVVDKAFARIVAPRPAALGFEQRRPLWNRRRGFWMDVIKLQQSACSHKLEGRFTLNLAMRLRRRGWQRPVDFLQQWVVRIGHLRPDRQDFWWRYDPSDPASAEAEVQAMLADMEAHGLPYLDRWPWDGIPGWARVRRLLG